MTRMIPSTWLFGWLRSSCCSPVGVLLLALVVTRPVSARTTVEAIPALPFGIAQITIDLPTQPLPGKFDPTEFFLTEANGRALYPVFTEGRFRRAVGGILGTAETRNPNAISVLFLFKGADPQKQFLACPTKERGSISSAQISEAGGEKKGVLRFVQHLKFS